MQLVHGDGFDLAAVFFPQTDAVATGVALLNWVNEMTVAAAAEAKENVFGRVLAVETPVSPVYSFAAISAAIDHVAAIDLVASGGCDAIVGPDVASTCVGPSVANELVVGVVAHG